MLHIFKKEKFPTKIFIIASLANLIILGLLFFFLKINFSYYNTALDNRPDGRYYLNSEKYQNDPLITKVPNLKDILSGPIIQSSDPSLGADDVPIVIIYFSDYACDYCQEQEKILKQVLNEYGNKVRLVWKDYPEIDIDSASWRAALAARCAQGQGRFWEYHDLLYERNLYLNHDLNIDFFISLAREVNLDKDLFKECLQNEVTAQLIIDNILEAQALGINGIPFIYINNQEVMGKVSLEDLKKMIETEMKK